MSNIRLVTINILLTSCLLIPGTYTDYGPAFALSSANSKEKTSRFGHRNYFEPLARQKSDNRSNVHTEDVSVASSHGAARPQDLASSEEQDHGPMSYADLERITKEIMTAMMKERYKDYFEELRDESSSGSSSSSQETDQEPPRKRLKTEETMPTLEELDTNGTALLAALEELQKHVPNSNSVRHTLRSAKSWLQKSHSTFKQLMSAPPHSAKELENNRSIVLLNVPESKMERTNDDDWRRVKELFNVLDVEPNPDKVYRVGKLDPKTESKGKSGKTKPRPIKVVLYTADFRKELMSSWKENYEKLRNYEEKNQDGEKEKIFAKIIIRRWLNKRQRGLMKAARAELAEREKNGEKNLTIRNFKVVSKDDLESNKQRAEKKEVEKIRALEKSDTKHKASEEALPNIPFPTGNMSRKRKRED
ncbi:hypothetical protein DdX_14486 [Ditylenchus destructor]|uniref:Uncharacterized protein n=1 Tax=Ditylenchus destructor TaxID=166010 RepID=A0AAD4MX03_9BILA|nr:hypothetical protein DdX_14486 [Ditylenchus destructor]